MDGLESILYLEDPGNSVTTTPTTMDSREIAASVGVDLKETAVLRDITSVSKLTGDQMRKAFSVIPTDYWQLNCWTCREFSSLYVHASQVKARTTKVVRKPMLSRPSPHESDGLFLAQKTQRRLDLANERAREEKTIRKKDQTMAPAAEKRPPNPSTVLANPNLSHRTNWPRRSNGG